MILIPQYYYVTGIVVLFSHLSAMTLLSIVQFFRMPPYTYGYKGKMTIEPNAIHIDEEQFPVSAISDFSIEFSTYKSMSKDGLLKHFTRSYTHSAFQPKRHTGISDNHVQFSVNGTKHKYLFYIESRQQLKSFENLIIMLAFSGLLTETEAVRQLRQNHNYMYADIQKFKSALRDGEKISAINQGGIGDDLLRRFL